MIFEYSSDDEKAPISPEKRVKLKDIRKEGVDFKK